MTDDGLEGACRNEPVDAWEQTADAGISNLRAWNTSLVIKIALEKIGYKYEGTFVKSPRTLFQLGGNIRRLHYEWSFTSATGSSFCVPVSHFESDSWIGLWSATLTWIGIATTWIVIATSWTWSASAGIGGHRGGTPTCASSCPGSGPSTGPGPPWTPGGTATCYRGCPNSFGLRSDSWKTQHTRNSDTLAMLIKNQHFSSQLVESKLRNMRRQETYSRCVPN